MKAIVSRKVLSPMGEDEYMRVKLGQVGGRVIATPLSRGAGVIMSLVRADGLVTIPRLSEGLHPGTEVEVELLRPPEEVAQTIVQVLAPPQVRGSIVGLFNTAILGLRAGSGLTVGVLGALIGIHWSLALSAGAVVVTAGILLTAQPKTA